MSATQKTLAENTVLTESGLTAPALPTAMNESLLQHKAAIFAGLLLLVALVLSAATLLTFPSTQPDEAFYANIAHNWIETGNRWTTFDADSFAADRGKGTTRLGAVPARLAIEIGGLNLRSLRLSSFLAGLLVLTAVVALAAQLWNWRVGMVAALALSLNQLFVYTSHQHRPEIWLGLAVLLALNASVRGWRSRQPLWDVLAAVLAGLSLEIHQHGAMFALALAATYFALYGRRIWRSPNALAFALTAAAGLGLYVWRNPWVIESLMSIGSENAGAVGGSHYVPLLALNPLAWPLHGILRYVQYFAAYDQMWLLLLVAALAMARDRDTGHRLLLTWLIGAALAMTLLVGRLWDIYLLPMICVAALLLGQAGLPLLAYPSRQVRRAAAAVVIVLLLPLLSNGLPPNRSALAVQQELQAAVPCRRILAPNQHWFAFTGCDFQSVTLINHYHRQYDLSLTEAMETIRPDYFILDRSVYKNLGEEFGQGSDAQSYYAMPEAEMRRFLQEHGTLERMINDIQIYRIDW